MSDTLYIQTDKNQKITKDVVTLGDVAKLSCSNPSVLARNQVRRIATLRKGKYGRYVCSMIDIIREIEKSEEHVEVTHIGEPTFILTYENVNGKNQIWSWIKTIVVSLITFFGTAFSIMTFNTDVDIRGLFDNIYEMFQSNYAGGFGHLEISYSVGIGIGVILYFNHFGLRRITQDPTPLEVEMRTYEDEVNDTVIEQSDRAGRGGDSIVEPAGDSSSSHRS